MALSFPIFILPLLCFSFPILEAQSSGHIPASTPAFGPVVSSSQDTHETWVSWPNSMHVTPEPRYGTEEDHPAEEEDFTWPSPTDTAPLPRAQNRFFPFLLDLLFPGSNQNGNQPSCPLPNGFFPNPKDCNSFFICVGGLPYLQKCFLNLHFNPVTKLCQLPHLAGCKSYIKPTSAPVPDTVATTPKATSGAPGSTSGPSTVMGRSCSGCGKKFLDDNRIVYGEESKVNEWPWQVYLQIRRSNGVFMCGGALYKREYAITAAHCVDDFIQGRATVAEHNLHTKEETISQIIDIEKVTPHEGWTGRRNEFDNDIAVVKLKKPVTWSRKVRPICLPRKDDIFSGKTVWVTGWGTTETGDTSSFLREIPIQLWSWDACKEKGGRRFTQNMICGLGLKASGRITDSCGGDSGGPLVHRNSDGRWILGGVVSHGPSPCGQRGRPGVYTRVTNYLDWIQEKTKEGKC